MYLTADGTLFATRASAAIDDFDACRPWYLRVDAQNGRAKAWQATDPEPVEWMIDQIPQGNRNRYLEVMIVGLGGGGELILDVIDAALVQGT